MKRFLEMGTVLRENSGGWKNFNLCFETQLKSLFGSRWLPLARLRVLHASGAISSIKETQFTRESAVPFDGIAA